MIAVRVQLRDEKLLRKLRDSQRRALNLTPVLRELRVALREDLKKYAAAKASPDGAWPARKESGRLRKRGKGRIRRRGRARKLLGRLPSLVQYSQTGGAVIARSKVDWAMAHQEGGRVGRGAVLPARPFVYISQRYANQASDRVMDYVLKAWS